MVSTVKACRKEKFDVSVGCTSNNQDEVLFGRWILTGAAGLAAAGLGLKALKAEAEEAKRAMAAANFILIVFDFKILSECNL